MPPEPLPWDRKEFKDRKHERGVASDAASGGVGGRGWGSGSTSRWREPCHGPRDFPRASPRKTSIGNHRHAGGYHQPYPEETSGHECTPRSGDRVFPEDEIFRRSSGRYGGGGRSTNGGGRESRGSWRSPYLDSGGDFPRPNHGLPVTAQRSAVPVAHVSLTSSSPIAVKDLNGNSGVGVGDVAITSQKDDRDHSLSSIDWQPLKWSRPGNFPSSKKVRSESEEVGLEISVPQGKETPFRSPVTSPLPSDDGLPRKKPRLGWGQGLAKYEKQKVEGSADISCQDGFQSTNSTKDLVSDSSIKVMSLAGSMSPATPTSATCSSSPGVDIKLSVKDLNVDVDKTSYNDLSNLGPPNPLEFSIKLDQLDANVQRTLASVLSDLMQPEDACSGDSSFTRYSTINKLLLLKNDISKELEKTECEVDLLENELKSLQSEVLGAIQHGVDSVDKLKALSELSSSDKCVRLPSEIQEVGSTSLSEDNGIEINDENHDSSIAVLLDAVKSSCLEKQSSNSINVQRTVCPVSINLSKQGSDLLHLLIQPSVEVPTDACSNDARRHAALACFDISIIRKADYDLVGLIMASNRDTAKRASQVFDEGLTPSLSQFNFWESDKFRQCRKNNQFVREKVAMNKRLLKFKEHALTLKFRALHQLWREDLRLLSMRKHRAKSNKRVDVSRRTYLYAFQKHPSPIRLRSALPGNMNLVPTIEMLNFTSKLLSDSKMRLYRNNLKMPAEIIDVKERRHSRFSTNNGLVDDPPSFEKARMIVNPWTQEEKLIFLDMLATFGKDFKKISSFLSHKTTADCIEFYYKNHKSDDFTEARKQLKLRNQRQNLQRNMYLMTSGTRLNCEANAVSLDLLGEASLIAAQRKSNNKNVQKHGGKSGCHHMRISCGRHGSVERVSSVEISGNEKEVFAADVLAGICGAFSSEAISSSVTSSVDPADKVNFATIDQCPISEVTQTIVEEDTCSDEGSGEFQSADWTDEEKSMFIRALNIYGKDFIKISNFVRTRSRDQCKIFYSKSRKCLGLDVIQSGSGNGVTPQSDVNGGRSDTDDGCAAEIDSAICSTQSCSKMDLDFTQSVSKSGIEGYIQPDNTTPMDTDRSCEQCEVAGSTPDELEGKIDKENFAINEDKIVIVRGDSDLGEAQGRINCAELISNDHGASESLVDAEFKKVTTGYMCSAAKPAAKIHAKDDMTELQAVAEVPENANSEKIKTDELKSEVDSKQFGMLLDSVVESRSSLSIEVADVGDSVCFAPNSNLKYNPSDSADPKNKGLSSLVSSLNVPHQVPVELLRLLHKRACAKPGEPGPVLPTPVNCVLTNSSSMSYDGAGHVSSQANLNYQNSKIKQLNELDESGTDFTQNHHLENLLANQAKFSLNAVRGFPFQSSSENLREMKVDKKINEKSSPGNSLNANSNSTCESNLFLVPRMNNEKCGLTLSSSRTGDKSNAIPSVNQSSSYHTTCLQGDSSAEKDGQSQRTGDVKLFGQILTHPASRKQCSSQEVDVIPLSSRENESATTKSSSRVKDASIFENSCFLHQQGEPPLRSYGFWDGSRVQTGFPSLPESSIKLAKYQGSVTTMPLCAVIDTVTNSRTTSRDQAYIQPLSEEKQLLEKIPELQKRGSFEMVSGYQHEGRIAHIGANIVGGGGFMVGSAGVLDPVAALQMHYSGRRAKILSGDLEPWMGDIGGR